MFPMQRTHIDLNVDTDEISDDIEDISHPWRSVGHDKAKLVVRHADEVDKNWNIWQELKQNSTQTIY